MAAVTRAKVALLLPLQRATAPAAGTNLQQVAVSGRRHVVRSHLGQRIDRLAQVSAHTCPLGRATPLLCFAALSQDARQERMPNGSQNAVQIPTIPESEAITNRISLIGVIEKDPELIWEDDGTAVTNALLVVRKWPTEDVDRFCLEIKSKDDEDVLPEIVCNNIVAGDQVLVEGQVILRPQNGESTWTPTVTVLVDNLKVVERGSAGRSSSSSAPVSGLAAKKTANILEQKPRMQQTTIAASSSSTPSLEEAWRSLFDDPNQYWDNRNKKLSSRSPDFKHKKTGMGLWLEDRRVPAWVRDSLHMLPGGSGESSQKDGHHADFSPGSSGQWGDLDSW